MPKPHWPNRKSKVNLLTAVQYAILNDDYSPLLEVEPVLTPALAIIEMCWDPPPGALLKMAVSLARCRLVQQQSAKHDAEMQIEDAL